MAADFGGATTLLLVSEGQTVMCAQPRDTIAVMWAEIRRMPFTAGGMAFHVEILVAIQQAVGTENSGLQLTLSGCRTWEKESNTGENGEQTRAADLFVDTDRYGYAKLRTVTELAMFRW